MLAQDPITWNEGFLTGVREIDEQHRILVNTLNEANARLMAAGGIEFLEQITRDLLSYALYHFETEEDLMQEYGYADDLPAEADLHLRQHRSFSAKVLAVRDGLKVGRSISIADLISFLSDWLVKHILNTDKKLGVFVVTKRSAQQ